MIQLYMAGTTRLTILARHDFFVAQFQARVLAQFQDVEGEADRFRTSEFERLRAVMDDGWHDEGDVAGAAQGSAEDFYSLLSDLRDQMVLGAIAGLYHQWDKELRDFVEHELHHYADHDLARKIAWDSNIGNVFDFLAEFGWDCRSQSFYADVEACRLVVNVYKHGNGTSLAQLSDRYPEFIDNPLRGLWKSINPEHLDHEWMKVTETHLEQFGAALRAFWTAFPERLVLSQTP